MGRGREGEGDGRHSAWNGIPNKNRRFRVWLGGAIESPIRPAAAAAVGAAAASPDPPPGPNVAALAWSRLPDLQADRAPPHAYLNVSDMRFVNHFSMSS